MSTQMIFQVQLALGYLACLLVFFTYIQPRLRAMDDFRAHRVIVTIHSFRFIGLAFLVPGVVGSGVPANFAHYAAYGDFATSLLAILALLMARVRPAFWVLVIAFNLVGTADLLGNYFLAMRLGLPFVSGQLGSMYFIPVLPVPMMMITHLAAFYRLLHRGKKEPALAGNVVLS